MKNKLRFKCYLIKQQPYSESSLILQAFSEQQGMISILAKGLRKSKYRQDILLNSLNEYEFIVTEPVQTGLYILNEMYLINEYPTDLLLETWICAQAGVELISKILIPQEDNKKFYLVLEQYLKYLQSVTSNPIAIFWRFVLHITALLGVTIDLQHCSDCHFQFCLGQYMSQTQKTQFCSVCNKNCCYLAWGNTLSAYHQGTGQLLCNGCGIKYGTVYELLPESSYILQLLPIIGNYIYDLSISSECIAQLNHFFLYYLKVQFNHNINLKSLDYYQ